MPASNINKYEKSQETGQTLIQTEAVQNEEPEKVLYSWKAPARPFKRRDREFYVTVIAIFGIVGLVLFLVEGAMPVMLLVAILFLIYVLNTVEPGIIEYQITSKGIKVGDKESKWQQLVRFWFSRRFNNNLLVFETVFVPGRLELVIGEEDKEKIKEAVSKYLKEEKAPPSSIDKVSDWVYKKLPGIK